MPEAGGETPIEQTPPAIGVPEAEATKPAQAPRIDPQVNGERLAQVIELADHLPKRPAKPEAAAIFRAKKRVDNNG